MTITRIVVLQLGFMMATNHQTRNRHACVTVSCGPWAMLARGGFHEDPRRRRLRSRQAARHRRGRARRAARRRGARRDQGHRRLPHRRVHALGRRSRGPVPGHLRARRRGRRRRRRRRRDHVVKKGDHVIPLYTPECRAVQVVPEPQDEPVHRHPRDAGQGPHARRHQPLLDRQDARSTTTWAARRSRPHRAARDRAREGARRRAVRQDLLHRLRRHDRHRRGASSRRRSSRARTSSSSGSAASASTSCRARASPAPTRSSASTSTRRARPSAAASA